MGNRRLWDALAEKEQLPDLKKFINMYRGSATGNMKLTDALGAIAAAIVRIEGDPGKTWLQATAKDALTDADVATREQVVAILGKQTEAIRRFGGEQYASTEIDVLGKHIWRLLRAAERGDVGRGDVDALGEVRDAGVAHVVVATIVRDDQRRAVVEQVIDERQARAEAEQRLQALALGVVQDADVKAHARHDGQPAHQRELVLDEKADV